jgi:hypothetical protein
MLVKPPIRNVAIAGLTGLFAFQAYAFTTRKLAFNQNSPTSKNSFKMKLEDLNGKFYSGDGLGHNETLIVEPNSSYNYEDHGCLGLYGSAKGQWRMDGDIMKFENRNDGPQRLVPVKWGARTYLFTENKIEHQMDLLFKYLSFKPNDMHGFSYVKEPLPPLTMKDFNSEPIIPDRYMALWQQSKARYEDTYKELPDMLEFLREDKKN